MTKEIDVRDSRVLWKGRKITGSHTGKIELKDGQFSLEDGELTGGEFVMDMKSITVTDLSGDSKDQLEGHLKNDDFFGVDQHPTSRLVFTSVEKKDSNSYGVVGDLTIKNETHPVIFDLELNENSASTKLNIDRSKYNVRYGSGRFFSNLGNNTIHDNFELEVNLKF